MEFKRYVILSSRDQCEGYLNRLTDLTKLAFNNTETNLWIKRRVEEETLKCNLHLTMMLDTISLFSERPPTLHAQPRVNIVASAHSSGVGSPTRSTTTELPRRNKRQAVILGVIGVAAAVGIGALGTWLFTQKKLVDVSAEIDSGPNDATIAALQQHETTTTINTESLKHTAGALEFLAQASLEQENFGHILATVLASGSAMDSVLAEAARLRRGIASVSHMKFTTDLVPLHFLWPAVTRLSKSLETRELKILPTQAHEFYELPLSFLYLTKTRSIRVIVHFPAYTYGSMMDLYLYLPSPIRLTHDRFFIPNPATTVVAMSKDRTKYRTMSRADLALCHKTGSKHYCPGQNYLSKHPSQSCLMALFQNQLKSIADLCPFLPTQSGRDYLIQLSSWAFILYQAKDGPVSVDCYGKGGGTSEHSFQGARMLTIPAGCKATSPGFTFEGEVDLFFQEQELAPHFQHATNLSKYFPYNVNTAEFDLVMREVGKIGSTKGIKIRDLAQILRESRAKWRLELSLGIAGTIIAVLVIAFLVWCCCCKKEGQGLRPCSKWCACFPGGDGGVEPEVAPPVRPPRSGGITDEERFELLDRESAPIVRPTKRTAPLGPASGAVMRHRATGYVPAVRYYTDQELISMGERSLHRQSTIVNDP